ncbi:hypothetical protein Q5752_006982 [Cryptotrichosporon argae]
MSLPSASASSSAPKKPVQLDPSKLYVHISTPSSAPPPTLPAPGVALIYVGLVGELAGEGLNATNFDVITRISRRSAM